MPYNTLLADRIRAYLSASANTAAVEKKMFRGLTFMINGKLCICVSGENLMCRFDPALYEELSTKPGFQPMIMKGKIYKGYCYVSPEAIKTEKSLAFWLNLCLDFNKQAKSSKRKE